GMRPGVDAGHPFPPPPAPGIPSAHAPTSPPERTSVVRTLITGGAGFIGSHLCERFLAEGHEVVAVDNLLTGSLENLDPFRGHPRFKFVGHDISSPLKLRDKVDNVLHFASPA